MKKLLVLALPLLLCGCSGNKSVDSINKKVVAYFNEIEPNLDVLASKTFKANQCYTTDIYYCYRYERENKQKYHIYTVEYLSYYENNELIIKDIYR